MKSIRTKQKNFSFSQTYFIYRWLAVKDGPALEKMHREDGAAYESHEGGSLLYMKFYLYGIHVGNSYKYKKLLTLIDRLQHGAS